MQKIATPQDVQAELTALMASIHESEKPERAVIAAKLRDLADRVAGDRTSFINDPAYTTHKNWFNDIRDINKAIEKVHKGAEEIDSAVRSLESIQREVGRDQEMLEAHLEDLLKDLRGVDIKLPQAIREFHQALKRFHGPVG